jgi:hypothetical protein
MVVQTEELLKQEGIEEERIITEGWESDAAYKKRYKVF